MSLDSVRSSVEAAKRHELRDCEISRKRKLRELYAITACLAANQPPDFKLDSPPDALELQFLEDNDLIKGRYFRDTTLPTPPQNTKAIHAATDAPLPDLKATSSNDLARKDVQLPRDAASPTTAAPPVPDHDAIKHRSPSPDETQRPKQETPEQDGAVKEQARQIPSAPAASSPEPSAPVQAPAQEVTGPEAPPDGPTVNPKTAAPMLPEDVAHIPKAVPKQQVTTRPGHKARTIHLPPKEVQEQRLRDIEQAQERRAQRERKEDEHLAATGESFNGEIASSPSSFGPHSTNTSRAEQHSPATSPDDTTPRRDSSFLNNDQQNAEIAKYGAPVSVRQEELDRDGVAATPDAQLRLEEEQAVRNVRNSIKSTDMSVPSVKDSDLTAEASKVIEETKAAKEGINGLADATRNSPEASSILPVINGHVPETSDVPSKDAPAAVVDGAVTVESSATTAAEEHSSTDVTMGDAGDHVARNAKTLKNEAVKRPDGALSGVSMNESRHREMAPQKPMENQDTGTSSTLLRTRDAEYRDREKSKAAGVIFPRQEPTLSLGTGQIHKAYAALKGAYEDPDKDYLIGMFDFQAHQGPQLSTRELLDKATKTYTTASKYASIREQQDYKILKRIYNLQMCNRWALRQMEKSAEPPRQMTFHDTFLAQMKWMRTDFREERRWKTAVARNLAEWCAEWVLASPEKRKSLQVKVTRKPSPQVSSTNDAMDEDIPSPPELVPSGANETESESFPEDDEVPFNLSQSYPPAALFSLGYDDVIAKIDDTPVTEKVLHELPSYESRLQGFPSPSVLGPVSNEPDIVPVSRLVTSKIVPKSTEPPRKRSRYEYEEEDDLSSYPIKRPTSERSNTSTPSLRFSRMGLAPEQTDVALFLPENKHVRDRLHAGHAFRPPSEFPMPSTSFFESRAPSQWLWDEDQRLRTLVKEYQFNWSLVAASLQQPSMFTSGAERRTPWECFERWVQLEGLPGEMAKTPYFRTYQSRLEAAQRTVSAQYQAAQQQAQQQAQTPGANLNTPRRRTAQPIRVERRRNNRFLALIDAMRKQARKRETTQHKQQEAAKAAALRKAHEAAPVRNSVHTPQEFSRLKYDREQKLQEKQELYRQQVLAAQRNALQQQQRAGIPGQQGVTGAQQQRMGTPNNAHGQGNLGPGQNGQLHPGMGMQARPHPGQPGMQGNMPNGMPGVPMNMPQAQMQMNMQGQRLPQDMRIQMQQRNLTQQQAQAYALQQQQQVNRANSMSGMQMGANGNLQSPSMLAANMSQGGPKVNGGPTSNPINLQGSSASPRMTNNQSSQPQALSSGHVPHITNLTHEIQLQNPQMSQAEASRLASERMASKMASARQNALNAATGATAAGQAAANAAHNQHAHGHNQMSTTPSPYQQHAGLANSNPGSASPSNHTPNQQAAYQQQMRQHMMQQQRPQGQQGSPNMGVARPESRSTTPLQPPQPQQGQGQHGSPRAANQGQQGQGQQANGQPQGQQGGR